MEVAKLGLLKPT